MTENMKNLDEEIAQQIKNDHIKKMVFTARNYSLEDVETIVCGNLNTIAYEYEKALSALRASWEKDIDKLRSDHTEYEKIINSEYAKVKALEAEKKGLEERVWEYKNEWESALYREQGLKAENAELKETLQGNICAYCLKHEVEDCPHNPNKRALETGPAGEGRAFLKETTTIEKLQAERDALTCALAEARAAIQEIREYTKVSGIQVARVNCESAYIIADRFLPNPNSQRASEEMKGLRKVKDAAELFHKTNKWEDAEALRKALEAYESRGKV